MIAAVVERILAQSYLIMIVVSLIVGLFVPHATALVAWNTLLLQTIFFLSCLKIQPKEVLGHLKDWRFLGLALFMMLVVFPTIVWLFPIHNDFTFALFLLAAMPAGMTTPLLVEIAGGRHSVAMVLTVGTSLLAPFSIPFLTKFLYGAQISVDALTMFKQLALVIFLPFVLAMIARALLKHRLKKINPHTKIVSIVLLGLLIAGAIAKDAKPILEAFSKPLNFILIIVLLYAFYLVLHLAGYFVFWWKDKETKQTSSIALTYMNFTLAIFLASQFFPQPGVVLPLVFSIIPWTTFMPIWLRLTKKNQAANS